ncbi:hypothetical protein ACQKIG_01180 [Bacillus safensis]|uniref:hypothetical protein n=1 Tax=Bacillus TaxID=1386 RepID=UPI00163BBBD2|nr:MULTISPECIES: hypothetical protein [Bacillus]MCR6471011.1 hypothetical protein [Bacillus safensis]MED4592110.1 hypothetical protein [Bacillus safensis]MED4636862.1 hypothetical protein [Bacillus safensis]QNH47427.1 hypothetical protein H7F25_16495 [Bacillus sp. PAMC28571]QNK45286.1 hypothetical protein H7F24_03820 [Bacillus sp. PAMC22265]
MSIIANEQAREPVFLFLNIMFLLKKFHFACGVRKHFFIFQCFILTDFFVIKSDHCGGESWAEIYLKDHSNIRAVLYQQALIHFKLGNDKLAKEYLQSGIDYLKSFFLCLSKEFDKGLFSF